MATQSNPLLKHVTPVNYSITRGKILERIEYHLKMLEQHVGHGMWDNAVVAEAQAEALIEVLEIDDCRSVGGFDAKRQQPPASRLDGTLRLRDRFNWLQRLPIGDDAGTELKRLRQQLDKIK